MVTIFKLTIYYSFLRSSVALCMPHPYHDCIDVGIVTPIPGLCFCVPTNYNYSLLTIVQMIVKWYGGNGCICLKHLLLLSEADWPYGRMGKCPVGL